MNHACSVLHPGPRGMRDRPTRIFFFPAQISVARGSYPHSRFVGAVMWLIGIAVIPQVAEMAIIFQWTHLHSHKGIVAAFL